MPRFEHTIEVASPVDDVFAFGNDPANWQRTMPNLEGVEIVEETEDGCRMTATYRMLGMSFEGDMELVVDEETHQTVTTFESPRMTGEVHYEYAETDDGTEVVQRVDYELGDSVFERVLEPVAARYNKRQFENALETTRDLVEAQSRSETAIEH